MSRNYVHIIGWLMLACILSACTASHPGGSLTTWPKETTAPAQSQNLTADPTAVPANERPPSPSALPESTATLQPENKSETSASPSSQAAAPVAIRIAVIGDYGSGRKPEGDVADLVKSWSPNFIITTGDNNYPSGAADTIDENVGKFYHEFIADYQGQFGSGADQPRFFPTLGNHDWDSQNAKPYLDYFNLPGNERYYDFIWEPVHVFILDSDPREPDGIRQNSNQADWLRQKLSESKQPWNLVVMHVPPYSSGPEGHITWMRWPYKDWGASAVLAGHDHAYERLTVDGLPYLVNGLGGGAVYDFGTILDESQFRYNSDYGAMLITADSQRITFEFYNRSRQLVDSYSIQK
jgi:tartrate-resistant acid phosphatase type 5